MTLILALIFSVTIQECHSGICADICRGSIATPVGVLGVYQVNCSVEIFKDGFDD